MSGGEELNVGTGALVITAFGLGFIVLVESSVALVATVVLAVMVVLVVVYYRTQQLYLTNKLQMWLLVMLLADINSSCYHNS